MKWRIALMLVVIVGFLSQCSTTKDLPQSDEIVKQLQSSNVQAYHAPVKLEVAWIPYTAHSLKLTGKNEWRVVKDSDVDSTSALPMVLLTYPEGGDSLWLDMNTDNETLGRLLKHTLMTQQPITRPFVEYIEIAKCSQCHPEQIEIAFK